MYNINHASQGRSNKIVNLFPLLFNIISILHRFLIAMIRRYSKKLYFLKIAINRKLLLFIAGKSSSDIINVQSNASMLRLRVITPCLIQVYESTQKLDIIEDK